MRRWPTTAVAAPTFLTAALTTGCGDDDKPDPMRAVLPIRPGSRRLAPRARHDPNDRP
ncbi:hypothetical protein AB0A76_12290 [Streptomyces exfoliatus]|uniref:Lipoprotein n=1 Tax=Streptomyces exfoliatus TaxID=1905 RepID=A0ABV3CUR8_STREX